MKLETRLKMNTRTSRASAGQAMIISVTFFMFISAGVVLGITEPVLSEAGIAQTIVTSQKALEVTQAGIEDTTLLVMKKKVTSGIRTTIIDGNSASVTVTEIDEDNKNIDAAAVVDNVVRTVGAGVTKVIEANFLYGAQVGAGGLVLENSSSVVGNVYANGPIVGENSNDISETAVSAGPGGLLYNVHLGEDGHAHEIQNAVIDRDAYYQSIVDSTVWGALYPNSADEDPIALPIDDAVVEEIKEAAISTVISSPCPYEINTDVTIGPAKIECDVRISGNSTVTLAGNIWIVGDLEMENNTVLSVTPDFADKSVAIVVDNPANRLTSSRIITKNSVSFDGSGAPNSYIMLLSQNESAEQGGGEQAIEIQNSASGQLILYAGHGEIEISNNVELREVTGYRVRVQNNAVVEYESGLESVLFPAGPSGTWRLSDWGEQ